MRTYTIEEIENALTEIESEAFNEADEQTYNNVCLAFKKLIQALKDLD